LDFDGAVISSHQFNAYSEFRDGPSLDQRVFAFASEYPEQAASLRFIQDDVVIGEAYISPLLLRDAITSIPTYGFKKNPEQRRNALLNKVEAIEEKISTGDIEGAVNKMKNDLLKHLKIWLIEDYQTEDILQYSKAEILILVEEQIERLESASN
jgi:hypothetical protein